MGDGQTANQLPEIYLWVHLSAPLGDELVFIIKSLLVTIKV